MVICEVRSFCSIAARLGCCSSSVCLSVCCACSHLGCVTCLPLLHLGLLVLILLDQVFKDLLQAIRIRLQGRQDIAHRPFSKNAIDHAEAFTIARERSKCLQDKSASSSASFSIMHMRSITRVMGAHRMAWKFGHERALLQVRHVGWKVVHVRDEVANFRQS